ncbi:hypothetical protein B0J11DRAFT_50555 [Dendryphion nanum]|uniref:Uncharacterized protein n=1 Tax=Dendryphion nanum TaxID=256645 RepID=A0A9P9IIT0_9PLEO|nr:hypothetical protein B0J11DRAFT_50555 [Dendryphion nanum]
MEVVGLIAACSSLAKVCGTVVTSLHSLAETFRHAELSILSIRQECETIQFAWSQIEIWASRHLIDVENCAQLREQLQKSVYWGELVMAALENDLNAAITKSGTFRRRAGLTWNAALFRDHQDRLHSQVQALQLLLHIINLPRDEDRLEVLSLKEKVFRDATESARSIIPSYLSSRPSVYSDTISIRTTRTLDLKYLPFSFDDDLFTSFVYKRNYRVPFMKNFTRSSRRSVSGRTGPYTSSLLSSSQHTIQPSDGSAGAGPPPIPRVDDATAHVPGWNELSSALGGSRMASSQFSPESMNLPYGNAVWPDDLYDEQLGKKISELLSNQLYEKAVDLFYHDGYDIAVLFYSSCTTYQEESLAFFEYLLVKHHAIFSMLIVRMAYSKGYDWIETFYQSSEKFDDNIDCDVWTRIRTVAKSLESAISNFWSVRPTALNIDQIDTGRHIALDLDIVSYLHKIGFRFGFSSSVGSLPVLPHPRHLEIRILSSWLDISPKLLATSLWEVPYHYNSEMKKTSEIARERTKTLIAKPLKIVVYDKIHMPLLIAAIQLLYHNGVAPSSSGIMMRLLLDKDEHVPHWRLYCFALFAASMRNQTTVADALKNKLQRSIKHVLRTGSELDQFPFDTDWELYYICSAAESRTMNQYSGCFSYVPNRQVLKNTVNNADLSQLHDIKRMKDWFSENITW